MNNKYNMAKNLDVNKWLAINESMPHVCYGMKLKFEVNKYSDLGRDLIKLLPDLDVLDQHIELFRRLCSMIMSRVKYVHNLCYHSDRLEVSQVAVQTEQDAEILFIMTEQNALHIPMLNDEKSIKELQDRMYGLTVRTSGKIGMYLVEITDELFYSRCENTTVSEILADVVIFSKVVQFTMNYVTPQYRATVGDVVTVFGHPYVITADSNKYLLSFQAIELDKIPDDSILVWVG